MTDLEIEILEARQDPVAYMENNGTDFRGLPPGLRAGYARWWCFGMEAGDFLQAVINGDLFEAFARADDQNLFFMNRIVMWFFNHGDQRCTRTNARSWREQGGHFGRLKAIEKRTENA